MTSPNITVTAISHFVPQQSDAEGKRYVFTYTITINNKSSQPYQLMSRHWVIQDGNMKIEEVYGDGVVGEQPVINPGSSYSYTSGAILETDIGTMEGRYFFNAKTSASTPNSAMDNEDPIEIPIPKFLLTVPRTVH